MFPLYGFSILYRGGRRYRFGVDLGPVVDPDFKPGNDLAAMQAAAAQPTCTPAASEQDTRELQLA